LARSATLGWWFLAAAALGAASAAAQVQSEPPAGQAAAAARCAAVEATDFARVAECMSLDELALQLTAFNPRIAPLLTGQSLEELVAAGLGTIMGVTLDPERVHRLQQLAAAHGHPPLFFFEDTERGERTILPSSLAQSFTWHLDLVEQGARMAARESAAAGYSGILGPVTDHSCTTRNGRSMETKGESPYLTARYIERLVRGFQGDALDHPDTVAATLKHWIGYQCAEDGTDYAGAGISQLELFETHAPPFEAGFRAGAAMYMPAFTQLQGVPMHMNTYANTALRARLGGGHAVAIGDFTGDVELIEHGVAGDLCDATQKTFDGQLHISLEGGTFWACLRELVESGALARKDVETRVIEVLELKERLGLYQDRLRYGRRAEMQAIFLSPEHRAIARELARAALVMLTRPEPLPLPLGADARILVTGPLAQNRLAMLGEWSARGRTEDVVTPCAGLQEAFGEDQIACVPIAAAEAISAGEIDAAVSAAADVDVVVLMLGEMRAMSGEAAARLYPGIPAAQYELVEALEATGKPLIAIVSAGRSLPVSRLAGLIPELSGRADVVFLTSQLGVEAGHAIADVLSGAHPPSGHLSVSLPCETGIISATFRDRRIGRPHHPLSARMRAFRDQIHNAGKWVSHFQETFHREDCPIAFPFGHGLSYTEFAYADFSLSAEALRASDPHAALEASVTITNTGPYPGVALPQLYIRDTVAVPAPRRLELMGFQRVPLMPGESARVAFQLTPSDLAIYTIDPQTGTLDLARGRVPQPDDFPVLVFIAESAAVSEATPQGAFVLTD
jgi:beta-glucosidase